MSSPELPRIENERHSIANNDSSDIFPVGAPSGTRVNINLKFFMVISAVLCRVKLVVLKKRLKEFWSINPPICRPIDKDKVTSVVHIVPQHLSWTWLELYTACRRFGPKEGYLLPLNHTSKTTCQKDFVRQAKLRQMYELTSVIWTFFPFAWDGTLEIFAP